MRIRAMTILAKRGVVARLVERCASGKREQRDQENRRAPHSYRPNF
jgi:hypothetical protein